MENCQNFWLRSFIERQSEVMMYYKFIHIHRMLASEKWQMYCPRQIKFEVDVKFIAYSAPSLSEYTIREYTTLNSIFKLVRLHRKFQKIVDFAFFKWINRRKWIALGAPNCQPFIKGTLYLAYESGSIHLLFLIDIDTILSMKWSW